MNPFLTESHDHRVGESSGRSDAAPLSSREGPSMPPPSRGRIKADELAELTSQLAIMTKTGVDLGSALNSLARQSKRPVVKRIVLDIHEQVTGGKSFSAALKSHERSFGATYVAMVSAGEASGKMSGVLAQLARLLRNELRLARSVRSMIAYPVLLTSVSSLVILALVLFVLPRFSALFEQYELPLPLLTQMLLAVANELVGRWFVWLPLATIAIVGAIVFRMSPQGKRAWDTMVLNAPLLKGVSRIMIMGRICRLLGLMLESGVPLLDCLSLVKKTTSNTRFQELFGQLHDDVVNGLGITQALEQSPVVPPAAIEMIATAERTGNLGEVAAAIGEAFEEDAEARLKQTVAVAEPMITVGMGFVIAVVVLAVMLPVFDLAMFAGK